MENSLTVNNKIFLPVKSAAAVFGYSRDHITRLAKAKKVIAIQVGRRWFVQQESLKNYFEVQKAEALARQSQLSLQRQQELAVKQLLSLKKVDTKHALSFGNRVALTFTCLLLVGSFILGQSLFAGVSQSAALATTQELDSGDKESEFVTPVFTSGSEVVVVVVDGSRSLEKPVLNDRWKVIAP